MHFVFCRLYPFSPSLHGPVGVLPVISLLLTNIVSPFAGLPNHMIGEVLSDPNRRRSWEFLVFNPFCINLSSPFQALLPLVFKPNINLEILVTSCHGSPAWFLWEPKVSQQEKKELLSGRGGGGSWLNDCKHNFAVSAHMTPWRPRLWESRWKIYLCKSWNRRKPWWDSD